MRKERMMAGPAVLFVCVVVWLFVGREGWERERAKGEGRREAKESPSSCD
jgi:hypothetical protein